MLRCTRKGCGKEFSTLDSTASRCIYHPGNPVFHEGLKSWSCCADVNKPVLEFDEFMKISGCTQTDRHTDETLKPEAPKVTSTPTFAVANAAGTETYASPMQRSVPPPTPIIEEDNLNVVVTPGTPCRRNGCKTLFVSDAINRIGDSKDAICTYHPAPPIFREGSKGYLCCKRRVLEFEEFLNIPGCQSGRHIFSPVATGAAAEEIINCRIDHYQTVDKVHVSIFAKKVDKERSTVKFDETQITINLCLPGSKRFLRVVDLFGPINPMESFCQFFSTKVELQLQKRDNRSWTILEKATQDISNINLTFGVGGRTGTVGAKYLVLDETNKSRV